MAFKYGVRKSGCRVRTPEYLPPEDTAKVTLENNTIQLGTSVGTVGPNATDPAFLQQQVSLITTTAILFSKAL